MNPSEKTIQDPHLGRVRVRVLSSDEMERVCGPVPVDSIIAEAGGVGRENPEAVATTVKMLRAATLGIVDDALRTRLGLSDDFTEGAAVQHDCRDVDDAKATFSLGLEVFRLSRRAPS